jgi:hypothetical protein
VAGGQKIGTVTKSPCANHIHMAMKKKGAKDYLDPTKYLESIFPTMPQWIQQCDDYKLVWKVQCKSNGYYTGG